MPPVPAPCEFSETPTACDDARNAALDARLDEIHRLEREYGRRLWIYSLIAVAIVAAAAVASWRRARTPADRRRLFANLGVAGVLLGVAAAGLLWLAPSEELSPPLLPTFLPAMVALASAAVGGLITRRASGGERPGVDPSLPWWRREAGRIAVAGGLASTGATLLLAWIYSGPQPSCGGSEDEIAPGWTHAVVDIALATTVAAVVFALVALVARRWVVALVCLVVNPAALLFMALSSCAFY